MIARVQANALGFTLLEMIVVMVIAGLAAGLLAPRVGVGWKRMQDRDFLSGFAAQMRNARSAAMREGESAVFRINGRDKTYGFKRPLEGRIPGNVDIYAEGLEQESGTGDFLVWFYSDGSARGSDLDVIFDGGRNYTLTLDSLFGSIGIERDDGDE